MAKGTLNPSQNICNMDGEITSLAENIAARFSSLPQVLAVVLAGSQGSLVSDNLSDLDFYVYIAEEIPVETRAEIARDFAERFEINNLFWEPGDEWIHTQSGRGIDIMYRSTSWIEEQLDCVLVKHQAKVGYTTCFWFNVLHSLPLFDRMGWFEGLLQGARQPYPDPLRKAIVAKNYPILRKNISCYLHQLELALERHDWASINHRTAALLASYFDIIFAVNSVPHPGEKRLVEFVKTLCQKSPCNFEEQLESLLKATSVNAGHSDLLDRANALIDRLDEFLIAEGLLTPSGELA